MSDRRRRRRVDCDEDSEEASSESDVENLNTSLTSTDTPKKKDGVEKHESEYESAEEEEAVEVKEVSSPEIIVKNNEEDNELHADLIDEEGGEEGIAEAEDVEGEFLDGNALEESDEEQHLPKEREEEHVQEDAEEEQAVEDEEDHGVEEAEEEHLVEEEDEEHLEDEEEDEEEENEELEEGECVEEERQQGDGEECSPSAEKELDFDEDRRNPQYIPKKGTFYEHDDRNTEEAPKEKEVDPARDKKKKKLWLDEGRWGHDRYKEDEQTPKSKNELIEAYGYDIRNEDCAPRARRRRRYGRGPNKYDRNWKDETAYTKEQIFGIFQRTPRGARRPRGGRGGRFRGNDTFHESSRDIKKSDIDRTRNDEEQFDNSITDPSATWDDLPDNDTEIQNKALTDSPVILNNLDFPALVPKEPVTIKSRSPERIVESSQSTREVLSLEQSHKNGGSSVRTQTFENSNFTGKPRSPVYEKPPRQMKSAPVQSQYRDAYKRPPRIVRGRRSGSTSAARGNRDYYPRPNLAPRLMDKQVRAINSEIDRLTLNDDSDLYQTQQEVPIIHEQKSPPKANGLKHLNGSGAASKNEDSSNRPKRYSSLRQRSLPETPNYQPSQAPTVPPPHPPFYEPGYQGTMYAAENVMPPSSQPQTTASPPVINPPQYQAYNPAPYQESYASMRLPVNNMTTAPRLFPQVTLSAGQPIIASTPCIAANPNLMNYPPPPPPPSTTYPQFTYQQYPAPPPAPPPPVSQNPDLYRSGITYYYPQSQHQQVRHIPQKRPKAAIPIVPPPDNELRRKSLDKMDPQHVGQRRNSVPCKDDANSEGSSVVRGGDSVLSQPPVEVES